MYVIGGNNGGFSTSTSANFISTIQSSMDGITWTTETNFPVVIAYHGIGIVKVSGNDTIIVMGGSIPSVGNSNRVYFNVP